MKFLIDAQLPARLARFLQDGGHDAVHTSALPTGNHTTDNQITEIADGESRVVVTKDRDFRDGHLLSGSPGKLLIVTTGNITNTELLGLFRANLDALVNALDQADFVELGPRNLVIHQRRNRGPVS